MTPILDQKIRPWMMGIDTYEWVSFIPFYGYCYWVSQQVEY